MEIIADIKGKHGEQMLKAVIGRIQGWLLINHETVLLEETERKIYDFLSERVHSDVRILFTDKIPQGDYSYIAFSRKKNHLRLAYGKNQSGNIPYVLFVSMQKN